MKKRVLIVLALLVALVGATLPATAANATTTGQVRVQLQTATGADWHKKGFITTVNGVTVNLYRETPSNSNGTATFNLPPGKYVFRVAVYKTYGGVKDGYKYATPVSSTIAIHRGESKTIGLRMYIGGSISGVAHLQGGKPLKYGTVAVSNAQGVLLGYSMTDAKGHYRIPGLSTGRYVVVFNYRVWADPKSGNVANYAWSYYKGSSLGTAAKVQAYAQNRFAGAVDTKFINGVVTPGVKVALKFTTKANPTSGRIALQRVSNGKYLDVDSVYGPVSADGHHGYARVHTALTYRLRVTSGGKDYYYTGEGTKLTTDVKKAKLVKVTSTNKSFTFGPR